VEAIPIAVRGYSAPVEFDLVREKVAALPEELPEAPAILTPIRMDTGHPVVPPEPVIPTKPGIAPEPYARVQRGRPAAVLVLLFPDQHGQARVLLTVRVPHLATHAGEVAFPGGAADEDDADPVWSPGDRRARNLRPHRVRFPDRSGGGCR
jgi:hypothetical protein